MLKQKESFLKYIRCELNYSAHTVLSYEEDLSQFALFLVSEGDDIDPALVTTDDVRMWVHHLSQKGFAVSSIRRKLQSLRAFYRFLHDRGEVKVSPVADVPLAKMPKHLPEYVVPRRMDVVLDEDIDESDFVAVRNKLVVTMFYETGMRRAEMLALKDYDIDVERGELKVHGKRNKDRIIPFCGELKRLIDIYRPLRAKVANGEDTFILTEKGMVLSGFSPDGRIVEMIELKDHPFFIATQAHPEFKSRPNKAHPLFAGLIAAAIEKEEIQ